MSFSKLPGALCHECTLIDCSLVKSSGPSKPKLVVVGEAPGVIEVEQGKPFVGPSGQLLDWALTEAGINPEEVYRANTVACRPPNNREPSIDEVAACMPRLNEELDELTAPVLALGKTATEALGMSYKGRGELFKWGDVNALHTYHPAYVLRKPDDVNTFLKDVNRIVNGYKGYNPKWENPDVIHVQTTYHLKQLLNTVPDNTWVAFDIETDQIRWYQLYDGTPPDPILMLQIAWQDDFGIVLDDVMLYDVPETREILREFFSRVRTAAHNGKFDVIFLESHIGLKPHLDFDTMLAHAILDENSKHGLKELVKDIFGMPDYEADLISQYLNSKNDKYSKIPFEPLAKYGVIDVIMVLQLRKLFQEQLEAQGRLEWPFLNVIMRGTNAFINIELRGIAIDVPYLQKVAKILEEEMEVERKACCESVGIQDINLNSTQQVAVVVYDMLGMPPPKNRRLPRRSTNHESMEPHAGKHPFIDHLMTHRRIAKMKSSYADNILESLDINGRVHASFLLQGTEVGRLSARNPALQTIPRPEAEKDGKGFYGALIRGAFVAAPGKKLLVVDYSQAELRVAAVEANEPFLFDVYKNDRDLHTEVAIAMYGPNWTKEQRVRCKMFNFSYLYGGSEFSFARDAGLPINVAAEFVRKYNKVMPNLARYRIDQFDKLCDQGFVQSRFGRRRNFPLVTRANADDARKACVHAPIAGTASDLTLLSATQLDEEGFEVVLSVHDSALLEVDEDKIDEVADYVVQVMQDTGKKYLPEVEWKADAEKRYRWCDPPKTYIQVL